MESSVSRVCRLAIALFATLLVCAVICSWAPSQAHAAKKTVYVVSKITVRNSGGSVVDTYKYSYNKHGMVKKRVWSMPGGAMTDKYTYEKGTRLVKAVNYEGGKADTVYTFKYDEEGMLSSSKFVYKSLKDKDTFTYSYDDKGRIKEIESGRGSTEKVKYDSKGRVIADNTWLRNIKYKYDKKGSVSKEYWDGSLFRTYKNSYKGKRLNKVRYYGETGRYIGYHTYTYKKMKVSAEDAAMVKKQQVQACQDLLLDIFW